jgi:hypothetical protein
MRLSTTRRSVFGSLALVCALVGPTAARSEIVSVPLAGPSNPAASLPPPTVLRGSPPAIATPVPMCPPGYTLSPGYGCVVASGGDYTEGGPGYDYWPNYDYDYPFGFPGFGFGAGRFHRFAGFHGRRGFHGQAGFHGVSRLGTRTVGIGHTGGFGRR